MISYKHIILGGGMVAGYLAKEYVDNGGRSGDLAIVSADDAVPYERPPLSKGFLAGKDSEESVLISPPDFYDTHGIDIRRNTTITSARLRRQTSPDGCRRGSRVRKACVRYRSTGPHARRPGRFAAKRTVSPLPRRLPANSRTRGGSKARCRRGRWLYCHGGRVGAGRPWHRSDDAGS